MSENRATSGKWFGLAAVATILAALFQSGSHSSSTDSGKPTPDKKPSLLDAPATSGSPADGPLTPVRDFLGPAASLALPNPNAETKRYSVALTPGGAVITEKPRKWSSWNTCNGWQGRGCW